MKHALLLAALATSAPAQVDWHVRDAGSTLPIWSVAFSRGVFVAIDTRPLLSADGIIWTRPEWAGAGEMQRVFSLGNRFLAVGSGTYWLSPDGAAGTSYPMPGLYSGWRTDSAVLNGSCVLTGLSADDGSNAVALLPAGGSALVRITAFPSTNIVRWVLAMDDEFLAGDGNAIYASSDGRAWSLRGRADFSGKPVIKDGTLYALVARKTSSDQGRTWQDLPPYTGAYIGYDSPAVCGSGVFTVAASGQIYTSPDGLSWTTREPGTPDQLTSIAFGNNTFVAVGHGGRITTSSAVNPPPAVVAPALTVAPSITVKWPSVQGLWYQPQSSPDMQAWTNAGDPIPGNGAEMSRSYETTGTRRFYRMLVK